MPVTNAPLAESASAEARAVHAALSDLLRAVQFRDRDRICCHDVSVAQCYALEAIALGGPLRLNELAATLFVDKSTASRLVEGLVAKGLVERQRDPADGRAVQLVTTPIGRERHGAIERDLLTEVEAVLRPFPPEVRRGMAQLLDRIARAAVGRIDAGGGCCSLRS